MQGQAFYNFIFDTEKQVEFLRENKTECAKEPEDGDGRPEKGRS